ncbi:MAG: DUF692 domain-containing protein [Myxococcales bacterium]|nr:DUF692 domain-containing protein [Myxococcales bacterium]
MRAASSVRPSDGGLPCRRTADLRSSVKNGDSEAPKSLEPCVGVGLRRVHLDAVLVTERRVDELEIVPENYVGFGGRARAKLDRVAERFPLSVHGVGLSLGGPDALDRDFLASLATLLDDFDVPSFSEHACFSRVGDAHSLDLLPLPFTEEAARWLGRRTREAAERLERPVALENVTYYATMPTSVLDEGAFLRAVLEEADGSLLLDVNNVFVNAKNHGRDPSEVLASLPLERTTRIHLADHREEDGVLLDDHSGPPRAAVMRLYVEALRRIGRPVPTVIEWDHGLRDLDALLDAADFVRDVARSVFAPTHAEVA